GGVPPRRRAATANSLDRPCAAVLQDVSALPPPGSRRVSRPTAFAELIQLVRGGDQDAAVTLVRRYEAAIRRAVRIQLDNASLRRLLDSTDVCQSVLASFFVRAALGQYEIDRPQQLLRLLTVMAHNKVIDQARKHAA